MGFSQIRSLKNQLIMLVKRAVCLRDPGNITVWEKKTLLRVFQGEQIPGLFGFLLSNLKKNWRPEVINVAQKLSKPNQG